MTHADLREAKSKHRRWKISRDKAGCISVNPANQNYFVTAHLNREVRLWDARKLLDMDHSTVTHEEAMEDACIASFEHGKACSSAYFDPSGTHLLSTSYDDYIRGMLLMIISPKELANVQIGKVWDINPSKLSSTDFGDFEPDRSVYHDNNTGAYTSVFKATWASNPTVDPYFTVGNMKRSLDMYGKDGKLIRKLDQGLTSVPAVTCSHPSLPTLFAGAAG